MSRASSDQEDRKPTLGAMFRLIHSAMVQEYARSNFGNPVYQTEVHPLFYWWTHIMWNDPEQDGVNGNERIYQENVEFDISRYKPCTFNGQPC